MMARMGRPKNTSSPHPMAGPMLVRPASRILAAPRPTSHTRTSPTTRVETETASHQASLPAQPNPSQLVLVCRRLLVPPMVAPEATTGACWETTSPVTLAPLCSSTRPLNTVTSPLTRPEMVTGASKAVRDPSTVPSTAADPWNTTRSPTCWLWGTSARPDRTTNASLACQPGPRRAPPTKYQDSEDSDSTQARNDRPYGARVRFVVRGSQVAPLSEAGITGRVIGRRITRSGNHRRSLAVPSQVGAPSSEAGL